MIDIFSSEYSFLLNEAEKFGDDGSPTHFIEHEGIKYTNVASAYLASQIRDKGLRYAFSFLSAREAEEKFKEWKAVIPSFIDSSFEDSDSGDENKESLLFSLLEEKFSDDYFSEKLLSTGDNTFVFENPYSGVPARVDKFLDVSPFLWKSLVEIRRKKKNDLEKRNSYVYSIGYGNLGHEEFLNILKMYGIEVVLDIRRYTISHNKYFGRDCLSEWLGANGIKYVWYGDIFAEVDFGEEDLFDENDRVVYSKLWNATKQSRLKSICEKAINDKKKVCFLSPEFLPEHSHRGRLIGERALEMGCDICHIICSKNRTELLLHSELLKNCSGFEVSYKNYWGYTPEAVSTIKSLEQFIHMCFYEKDSSSLEFLSNKKMKSLFLEIGNELNKI